MPLGELLDQVRKLTRDDVALRLGKTKGYQNLKDRSLVPAPEMTHPDRWRPDQLLGPGGEADGAG